MVVLGGAENLSTVSKSTLRRWPSQISRSDVLPVKQRTSFHLQRRLSKPTRCWLTLYVQTSYSVHLHAFMYSEYNYGATISLSPHRSHKISWTKPDWLCFWRWSPHQRHLHRGLLKEHHLLLSWPLRSLSNSST